MDFIPFNQNGANLSKTSTPHSNVKNSHNNSKSSNLSFGSPASVPAFGSPAVPFGSTAFQTGGSPYQRTPSPRHHRPQLTPRGQGNHSSGQGNYGSGGVGSNNRNYGQGYQQNYSYSNNNMSPNYSPRHSGPNYSPRHNGPQTFSPYSPKDFQRQMSEPSFKTPQQYSPNYGRGNGRKSFNKTFGQTPRFDRNCNPGGSINIEDYYCHSMVVDPWQNLVPVLVQK